MVKETPFLSGNSPRLLFSSININLGINLLFVSVHLDPPCMADWFPDEILGKRFCNHGGTIPRIAKK
jgi:hypothetical protein